MALSLCPSCRAVAFCLSAMRIRQGAYLTSRTEGLSRDSTLHMSNWWWPEALQEKMMETNNWTWVIEHLTPWLACGSKYNEYWRTLRLKWFEPCGERHDRWYQVDSGSEDWPIHQYDEIPVILVMFSSQCLPENKQQTNTNQTEQLLGDMSTYALTKRSKRQPSSLITFGGNIMTFIVCIPHHKRHWSRAKV